MPKAGYTVHLMRGDEYLRFSTMGILFMFGDNLQLAAVVGEALEWSLWQQLEDVGSTCGEHYGGVQVNNFAMLPTKRQEELSSSMNTWTNYDGTFNITKVRGNTWMLYGRELPDFPMRTTQMRIRILNKRYQKMKVLVQMKSTPIKNPIHNQGLHRHDK